MNNIYYYTWYLLCRFCKKINTPQVNPSFAAVCLLSFLMAINLLPIVNFSGGLIYRQSVGMANVKDGLVLMLLVAINSVFILRNKKSIRIEAFFDEQHALNKRSNVMVLLAWAYIIGSVVMGGYVSLHMGKV